MGLHRGSQDESLEPVTPLSDPDAHLVRRGALLPPKMEMDDEPGDILIENEELIEEEEDEDEVDAGKGTAVNGAENGRHQGDEVNIRLRSVYERSNWFCFLAFEIVALNKFLQKQ